MILTDAQKGLLTLGTTLGLGFALGIGLGWKLYKPKPQPKEVYAKQVIQQDGSKILEKKPDEAAKPAQDVPKGAKVERIIQVVVKPKDPSVEAKDGTNGKLPEDKASPTAGSPCPPVTLDLTLVRMEDKSRRVIASSPDGTVLSGIEIPVEPVPDSVAATKYGAGFLYRLTQTGSAMGVWLDRDIGPFRTGVEIARSKSGMVYGWEAGGRIGIRW